MPARKKKRAMEVQRKYDKAQEISRWVRHGERREDVEVELDLDDSMKLGDDASSSEDEEDRGTTMTSVYHREPKPMPIGDGSSTGTCSDAHESRKRAMSEDAARDQETKRAQSPHPLDAPPASQPPTVCWSVGGMQPFTSAFGVSASAQPPAERCPTGRSGGFTASWRPWPFVGRWRAGRVTLTLS